VHPFDSTLNAHLRSHHTLVEDLYAPAKDFGDTPEQVGLSMATYAWGRLADQPKVSHHWHDRRPYGDAARTTFLDVHPGQHARRRWLAIGFAPLLRSNLPEFNCLTSTNKSFQSPRQLGLLASFGGGPLCVGVP
jgi:hypothetical protein